MAAKLPTAAEIEAIPHYLWKTIPAGSPPAGTVADFVNPPTRVPVVLGVGTTFCALATICFAIRIYTRLFIAKKWRWDDLTIGLGFACSIVFFGLFINGSVNGATGKHEWDMHLNVVLNDATNYQSYAATILTSPALGLIKCSLFIQWYVFFSPLRWIRICVWVGFLIAATFYITNTVVGLVECTPWGHQNWIDDLLSNHYIMYEKWAIPGGVMGMLLDWYLMILPIPAVWGLKTSMRKRIGILLIFMTGTFGACASIVSLYYRVVLEQDEGSDPTWKVAYVLLWSLIEMFAGVAASSMPTISQFFQHHNFQIPSVLSFSALRSTFRSRSFSRSQQSSRIKTSEGSSSWRKNSASTDRPSESEKGSMRMHDLESGDYTVEAMKVPLQYPLPPIHRAESQIRLFRDVEVTSEDKGNRSFSRQSRF